MKDMTEGQRMWVAGIIEGEGFIGHFVTTGNRFRPVIEVRMTDLDVIQRLADWTGLSAVRTLPAPRKDRKQVWRWGVVAYQDWLDLADAIEPHLLSRRAGKLRETREALTAHIAQAATCSNGHDKPEAGRCGQCARDRNTAWRAREKEKDPEAFLALARERSKKHREKKKATPADATV